MRKLAWLAAILVSLLVAVFILYGLGLVMGGVLFGEYTALGCSLRLVESRAYSATVYVNGSTLITVNWSGLYVDYNYTGGPAVSCSPACVVNVNGVVYRVAGTEKLPLVPGNYTVEARVYNAAPGTIFRLTVTGLDKCSIERLSGNSSGWSIGVMVPAGYCYSALLINNTPVNYASCTDSDTTVYLPLTDMLFSIAKPYYRFYHTVDKTVATVVLAGFLTVVGTAIYAVMAHVEKR